MNTQSTAYPDQSLLQYNQLRNRFMAAHEDYVGGDPFPHIVLDDLVSEDIIDTVLAGFPTPESNIQWRQLLAKRDDGEKAQYNKQGMPHLFKLSPEIRQLIWEFNSSTFIRALEGLTGIDNLIPDPSLRGGGLHQILPGGILGVHADFTHHVEYNLHRRVNLLLYLNKDWKDGYQGHLELWNQSATQCVKRIRPTAGRCVIFNTDDDSFHGHPRPLDCPQDRTRKSIALYYYTVEREDKAVAPTQKTDWQVLPDVELPPLI